jgi:hypothetical protein
MFPSGLVSAFETESLYPGPELIIGLLPLNPGVQDAHNQVRVSI